MKYSEMKYPLQEKSYQIIGICMEIHHILGKGFLGIVNKDALAISKCPLGLKVNFGENSSVS